MIVLNLACSNGHRFEGWFGYAEDFQRQAAAGEMACPMCGDNKIIRLPASPHVKRRRADEPRQQAKDAPESAAQDTLRALTQALIRDSEDVGDRFPEEARKIHYEEVPARSIRGIATLREAGELIDEGIVVVPLPVPPDSEVH